jgi:photosystem II stability/assembly factor-like uncharacterized protein
MRTTRLFWGICVLWLVACGPVTPVVPAPTRTPFSTATPVPTIFPSPDVTFLSPVVLERIDERGISWSLSVYALNQNDVFLFGAISDSAGSSAQSILLRSGDGGKHWTEVMHPVRGSDVIDFQMFESGEGWTLVMWTVEGPGTVLLFHTKDFGQTWEQIAEIQKPEWFAFPSGMKFFDNMQGLIKMCVAGGLHDRLAFFTTADGGATWKETGSYVPPFDDGREKANAIYSLCSWKEKDFSTSLMYDSQWKLESVGHNSILSRQLQRDYLWGAWEIIGTFPDHLKYQNDQISIP